MGSYYFLATALPEISMDSPLEIDFFELMTLYYQNLSKEDLQKFRTLRLEIDFKNVKESFREGPFDPRGNFDPKDLEDALINEKDLPEYLFEYLSKYEETKDKIQNFSEVFVNFYKEESTKAKGFLKEYFLFQRYSHLLLVAYRAKKRNLDILQFLKEEDLSDPFVQYLVSMKDMPQIEFPYEFLDLQETLLKSAESPEKQSKEILAYKIKHIKEMAVDDPFSIDWLLVYMKMLIYLEGWHRLDENQGIKILKKLIKESA